MRAAVDETKLRPFHEGADAPLLDASLLEPEAVHDMLGRQRTPTLVAVVSAVLVVLLPGAAARATAVPAGLIAFETQAGIHLINADGTNMRRLPGTKPGDQGPRWSPDGSRLVFWRDEDSEGDRVEIGEIYVINADGSGRKKITKNSAIPKAHFPDWSPDGTLIAFGSVRNDSYHIWVMKPDGSAVRRLTRGVLQEVNAPSWAPDSKRIAFTALRYATRIAVIDLNRKIEKLRTGSPYDIRPAWSPTGELIAFTRQEGSHIDADDIYVVSARGGAGKQLTRYALADSNAQYGRSPEPLVHEALVSFAGRTTVLCPPIARPRNLTARSANQRAVMGNRARIGRAFMA